jgi:hypothetical protein
MRSFRLASVAVTLLALAMAVALTGCGPDIPQVEATRRAQASQQLAAAKAACHEPTAVGQADCLTRAENAWLTAPALSNDLIPLYQAKRREIAGRLDRHMISADEARVEFALLHSQFVQAVQQRTAMSMQAAAAWVAATAPPPAMHCTAYAVAGTLNSDCWGW